MVNSAVAFTAADKAYLSIADASQTGLDPLTGDYSYSFWVNPTTVNSVMILLSKAGFAVTAGYQIYSDTNGALVISHNDGTGVGAYNTGLNTIPERIDGVGFIKRILTASERTALYNNGKGVKYAGLPSSIRNDSLLSGFWNLDQYSDGTTNVTRMDSTINANHLTAVGNPPSAVGVANSSDYPTTVCGEPSFIY